MAATSSASDEVEHSQVWHDQEKGFGHGLQKTTTGVTMSPELFEKLYLSPKVPQVGDNNKRYANPTPLGLIGFVISTFTFSMVLLGFGGASGFSPLVGMFLFTGPVLLVLACIMEFICGNFFSMQVMGLFAVFWLSFGMLQLPTLQLGIPFATTADPTGTASEAYNAAIALYLIVWGFALLTFFVFTLKTNMVFAGIFFFVTVASFILSAAYWKVSTGDYALAMQLTKAGGSLLFVVACLGWYITIVIMAAEMRMTTKLPTGDLSHFWPDANVSLATEVRQD